MASKLGDGGVGHALGTLAKPKMFHARAGRETTQTPQGPRSYAGSRCRPTRSRLFSPIRYDAALPRPTG